MAWVETGNNVLVGKTQGGKVYFEAKMGQTGEWKKAGNLLIVPLTLSCSDGTAKVSIFDDATKPNVVVKKRKFRLTLSDAVYASLTEINGETGGGELGPEHPFTGSFSGTFEKNGPNASGTFDFGDPVDLGNGHENCDTAGPQPWEAKVNIHAGIDGRTR